MSNKTETAEEIRANLERYDEYYENLRKKHPDTIYSLDPAEREEEMKNEPVLSIEELKVLIERPLDPDASPEEIELNKQCRIFLYETMIPFEELLDKLDRGEIDDLSSIGLAACEEEPEETEIPSPIEDEDESE